MTEPELPFLAVISGLLTSCERQHAAGLEVVPQAQRVADLVHHDFLDRLGDELFGHLAAGVQLAPGGQDGRQNCELPLHARPHLACADSPPGPRRHERPAGAAAG